MMDPRIEKLAGVIVHHSIRLRRGEKVLIEGIGADPAAVEALVRAARKRGGVPLVILKEPSVTRELLKGATEEGIKLAAAGEAYLMRRADAYVGLRGGGNSNELADVPPAKMGLYMAHWWKPVHLRLRCFGTKWTVLRWPSPAMAQEAGMSTEAFEDFYFNVCTLDYGALSRAMAPLERRMKRAKRVHIKGPGTDLSFSVAGISAARGDGRFNLPDGEVATAPVKDSVSGVVTFNTPSIYEGVTFEGIRLEFERGKAVRAACSDKKRLEKILDGDRGSRYTGEFALGVNPRIRHPMKDTLFDEKIAGSFHLALGDSLDDIGISNGNRSRIHWDLVCVQTPKYGGGEIRFDGELIRRNGRFTVQDLKPLDRMK